MCNRCRYPSHYGGSPIRVCHTDRLLDLIYVLVLIFSTLASLVEMLFSKECWQALYQRWLNTTSTKLQLLAPQVQAVDDLNLTLYYAYACKLSTVRKEPANLEFWLSDVRTYRPLVQEHRKVVQLIDAQVYQEINQYILAIYDKRNSSTKMALKTQLRLARDFFRPAVENHN
jgi:hypothetical protein